MVEFVCGESLVLIELMVITISFSIKVVILTGHHIILTIIIGGYIVTIKFVGCKILVLVKLMIITISVSMNKVVIFTTQHIILTFVIYGNVAAVACANHIFLFDQVVDRYIHLCFYEGGHFHLN